MDTHGGSGMDGYDVFQQIGHLLRRAYQRHLAIFQEAITDETGVTSVQFVTLCALRDVGPCSQTALVRLTAIDQATIRGIIERLRARDLIGLSKDSQDARKVILSLTAKGEAIIRDIVPRAREVSQRTMGDLNAAEQLAITVALKRMIGDLGG